ncbi:MAG TPA: hypothetical protein VLD17_09085 [Gemmatimonadaceae bacterium]|jgi:hypothetical protein|nr:hypothetical protein [Gemmatimonadaceae bacterium]
MRTSQYLTLAAMALAVWGCNPFHRQHAVEVSNGDVNLNARWHANLATPAELAGAVQMKGSATMAPSAAGGKTTVTLDVANAAPGGVHPWAVHRGQCGADDGVFGSAESYQPVQIDGDGHGSAVATIPVETPTAGKFFVSVSASAGNRETIVACGNLAPPTP